MLEYNELKENTLFIKDNQPYEVLEYNFLRMQQRKPVAQLKIKNLITGKVINFTAHPNDYFKEAEINIVNAVFIYQHKNLYWFYKKDNPKERFSLPEEIIGDQTKYLKPNLEIKAFEFQDKIINIELPIKIDLKVIEAPPNIKGGSAQNNNKIVTLETGAKITVPNFINEGDIIRINTKTDEYVERIEKNK